MTVVNRASAAHYTWGGGCDGWRLLDRPDLSVIDERIPPGLGEVRHHHGVARQLFVILDGTLTMERDGDVVHLHAGDAAEVTPGTPHRVWNDTQADVRMLVISAPSTRGDRTDLS